MLLDRVQRVGSIAALKLFLRRPTAGKASMVVTCLPTA